MKAENREKIFLDSNLDVWLNNFIELKILYKYKMIMKTSKNIKNIIWHNYNIFWSISYPLFSLSVLPFFWFLLFSFPVHGMILCNKM